MFTSSNKTESRIVRFFWNDGLLAGSGVCLMGCAWQFNLVPLGAIAPGVLIPFWKPLRAKITEPRLGFVELSDAQQQRNNNFLATAVVLGVLTLFAAVATYLMAAGGVPVNLDGVVPEPVAALPAFIFAVMALMTATITSIGRFVLYAAVFAASGVTVALLGQEPSWSLLAGGLAIVLGGGITLSRFIARYPRSSPVENGASHDA